MDMIRISMKEVKQDVETELIAVGLPSPSNDVEATEYCTCPLTRDREMAWTDMDQGSHDVQEQASGLA